MVGYRYQPKEGNIEMFSIILAISSIVGIDVPACVHEDAIGTICQWDGESSGNGYGSSFIVLGEEVIYE